MNLLNKKPPQTRLRACISIAMGAAVLAVSSALSASYGLKPVLAQISTQTDHAPSGWFLAGSKPQDYRTGVDKEMLHDARPSAYLAAKTLDNGGFGTLMQSIDATNYAGKRVRLRAWVRSKNVANWAGLWMRIDKGATTVGFDNMQQRAVRGTQDWKTYDVVLDVPSDATGIAFGTLLMDGPGEVWISDVKFEAVTRDVQTTGDTAKTPASTPVNLSFQD